MKIALCFFGRINHYEKKYLVESLDSIHSYDVFYSADNQPQELLDDFINIYKPKSINNEKISYDVNFGLYPPYTIYPVNIHNMTCHFLNKKRVFGLLETYCNNTNTTYDLVVSSRLDLSMEHFTPCVPMPNTIYIPEGENHNGINDRFAYGDFSTMKQYMNIYDSCLYLLDHDVCVPHPETLTLHNIMLCKLNIVRFPLYQKLIR